MSCPPKSLWVFTEEESERSAESRGDVFQNIRSYTCELLAAVVTTGIRLCEVELERNPSVESGR